MGLFQKSVLKNYLSSLDDVEVSKAYDEYRTFFFNPVTQQNIRNSKEEQFQEGFLRELFVKIMGYTLNPDANYNLISEQKNVSDAKKADGAILIDGKVVGVIELKGTNTIDLGKIQQQAFYYLSAHPEAVYVITSNFEKLRFYIQKSNDYEDFNLFTLTLDEFKLLYLCISLDSISNGLPLKIKQESLVKEEVITKQLYKDYTGFKNDLFNSLCNRNNHQDKLSLFKATQKLIDRFLFIFFCEDNNGLLPANSIAEIIKHWNKLREMDEYKPLYDIFKKYFEYINSGRAAAGDKREIFAYNGGLFAEDSLLDKLDIDDNVLYTHTQKLSTYDFISEVDVNILGHIFEHSLNDIEEIQAELAGEIVDKSKTKRKKDGVFYTPKYITEYIVENTVGKLCADKKAELEIDEDLFVTAKTPSTRKPLFTKIDEYKKYLLSITICDPACGSGAFLNQAYVFLQKEHQYVADLESKLFDAPMVISDVSADILENNLFGVDINEESVEIARLALWLRSAKKGRKLNNLSNNIKCGNSLIDDPEVAGDKAFNWEKEFPQVFAKGGFDVVIGNPPYVPAEQISKEDKNFYESLYSSAFGRLNLYPIFYEKGVIILKKEGVLGYITPYTLLKNQYFIECRKFLLSRTSFNIIVDFKGITVFPDAGVDSIILVITNSVKERNTFIQITDIIDFTSNLFTKLEVEQSTIYKSQDLSLIVSKNKGIIEKSHLNSLKIEELVNFKQGIITGANSKYVTNIKNELSKSVITGSDFNRFTKPIPKAFITYDINSLHRPRVPEIFEIDRKILLRQTGSFPICTVDFDKYYTLDTVHNGKLISEDYNVFYLVCLLNSKLLRFLYNSSINEEGKLFAQVKIIYINPLPVKILDIKDQEIFSEFARRMREYTDLMDQRVIKFLSRIQSNLHLQNITGKLEKFYEHDFKSFVDELKKQKVILSLKDQDEWEDYFNTYKQEINTLQEEIARTDKEIDQMVYELYGLTEDEIRVVEGG